MLEPRSRSEYAHRQLIWRSLLHPMRWLLTKALYPYVLIAATARAARAAAEGEGRTRNPDLLAADYIARAHPPTWW